MRTAFFLTAALGAAPLLGGCGGTSALSTTVQFQGFMPGCVRAIARDAASGEESTDTFPVDPGRGQHRVAIYRPEGWGDEVTVRVQGLEQDCDGPTVAQAEETARFPERGFNELTLVLSAADLDGDGFVSTGATLPGRDCDDADHFRAPGLAETCDGKDNDCDGQSDESACD